MRDGRYTRSDPGSIALNSLVAHLFPQLLLLAQGIVAQTPTSPATLAHQGALLHLIVKSYKHSLGAALTPTQQAEDSIVPWITLFLAIIEKALPNELLTEDSTAREVHVYVSPSEKWEPLTLIVSSCNHSWVKAKKWSLYSLNRLFSRYGNPTQLPSNMKDVYGTFADRFMSGFMNEIMTSYLRLIERSVRGEWTAGKCKHHLLSFFEEWSVFSHSFS